MALLTDSILMRVTSNVIDYRSLAELLDRSGSPLMLAELHGGLCGVFCAGGRDSAAGWLGDLLDDCTADAATLSELSQGLEALGDATWQALNGLVLEFEPMLPEEDTLIDDRAEALALWCHGFLAGLVIGGLDLAGGRETLSAELAELVRDFAEISKAGADADEIEDPESGDGSLTELVEYVRVGAQLVFEELAPEPDSAAPRTLH